MSKQQDDSDNANVIVFLAFLILPAVFGLWWMYGLYLFVIVAGMVF